MEYDIRRSDTDGKEEEEMGGGGEKWKTKRKEEKHRLWETECEQELGEGEERKGGRGSENQRQLFVKSADTLVFERSLSLRHQRIAITPSPSSSPDPALLAKNVSVLLWVMCCRGCAHTLFLSPPPPLMDMQYACCAFASSSSSVFCYVYLTTRQ